MIKNFESQRLVLLLLLLLLSTIIDRTNGGAFLPKDTRPTSFLSATTTTSTTTRSSKGLFQQRGGGDIQEFPHETTTEMMSQKSIKTKTLAASYLIETSQEDGGSSSTAIWSLIPIEKTIQKDDNNDIDPKSGYHAWSALHTSQEESSTMATIQLKCERIDQDNKFVVTASTTVPPEEEELLMVLSKIMVQWVIAQLPSSSSDTGQHEWNIVLFPESKTLHKEIVLAVSDNHDINLNSESNARQLFDILHDDKSTEMVEMVDSTGQPFGIVPRKLVHKHNLLHRGIGITVSPTTDFSKLYVHRRTKNKRIFPNLYDMFVGGVSLANEDPVLTAKREVAEELGLSYALHDDDDDDDATSSSWDPLFTCIVCTACNRCVVTVFCYCMDITKETISWQEEEVAWGDFVPLSIIEAAADLSIQRLASKKEWPGSYPPIQSQRKGSAPTSSEQYTNDDVEDWTQWDFVPDGLLVWEAWLQERCKADY